MSPLRSRQRPRSYPSILNKGPKSNRFYNRQQYQEQEQQQQHHQQQQEKSPSTNSIDSNSSSVALSVDSTIISAVDTTVASSSSFRPVISVNIHNHRSEDIGNESLSLRTDNDDNEIPETETNNNSKSTCSTNVTPNILTKDFEQYFKIMIKNSENIIGSNGIRNSETTRDEGRTENKNEEKKYLVAPPIEKKEDELEGELEEVCRHGSQWVLNQRFVLSDIGKDVVKDPSDDCVAKVDLFKAKVGRGKRTFDSSLSGDEPFIDDSGSGSHSSSSSSSSSSNGTSNNKEENNEVINTNHDIKNPPIGSLTIIDANHGAGGFNNDSTNCRTRNVDEDEDEFADGKSEGERTVAQGLALKLIRDLESVRQENERCTSRNRRLQSQLHKLKSQQDEHMIHRIRLLKACIYTMPVFVLCGGLDAFLTTILLVWVLVEVDSYMDLGDEGVGGDDDDNDDEDDLDDLDDLDSNDDEDDDEDDEDDEDEDEESRNHKYFTF